MTIYAQTQSLLSIRRTSFTRDCFLIAMASLLIALCAPIAIPLPFTPVPVSIQPHVCLFLGAVLGSKRGALAVLGFLAQGSLGLPVFAGGVANLAWAIGPKAGYRLGYVFATFLTGILVERCKGDKSAKTLFGSMALGNLVIYALGSLHLSAFVGYPKAFILGVLPFLLGDALKLLAATRVLKALRV